MYQVLYADFLLRNIWWIIALCVIAIFVCVFLLDYHFKKKKKKVEIKTNLYLEALGGEENVIDRALDGSRIILRLKDYNAVNRDKLREAGVTGFIQMSDRLTLVIKENAMEVYNKIFPNV